ncbi:t-complex protein 1 subunit delta [Nephila pilipes]|uniref:T-complex protein 1 subunit delta n=1 Tax=Nephila pilipes TaxID=299642 RepID=A0A8X6UQP1_NEPPI|nr:t-complex protein 1 subunit delta [Nephila pilipes]
MARCDENVKAVQQQELAKQKDYGKQIMKELELSPYKIQVTQPLNEDHTQRRSEFAQLMLEKLQTGEIDVKKIWFSYEAYFTLDGHLNKQNYRYWSRERLEITAVRSLHPKKFLVWCAISSHGVFSPIFIDGTLSAANYRKFLDEELIPFLHGHDFSKVIGLCRMEQDHIVRRMFSRCSMSILAIESLG